MQSIPFTASLTSGLAKNQPYTVGDIAGNAYSIAHGAGRKWKRSEAKGKLTKLSVEELSHNKHGGIAICEDRDLIYEEASQAYKSINQVIEDLLEAGLIKVIASYKPMITYKKQRKNNK